MMNDFAKVIYEAKLEMQCSVETLAKKMHIPPSDLRSWLKGETIPENPYVYMLAMVALKMMWRAETDPDLRNIIGQSTETEQLKELASLKRSKKMQKYIIFPPENNDT